MLGASVASAYEKQVIAMMKLTILEALIMDKARLQALILDI